MRVMYQVMHFWREIAPRVKTFEVCEKEVNLMSQVGDNFLCTHWSHNVVYYLQKAKEIFPVLVIIRNKISNK